MSIRKLIDGINSSTSFLILCPCFLSITKRVIKYQTIIVDVFRLFFNSRNIRFTYIKRFSSSCMDVIAVTSYCLSSLFSLKMIPLIPDTIVCFFHLASYKIAILSSFGILLITMPYIFLDFALNDLLWFCILIVTVLPVVLFVSCDPLSFFF